MDENQQTFSLDNKDKRLQLLHQIVSQSDPDLNNQLSNALNLTADLLGMELGIISHISGDDYYIRNCISPNGEIQVGDHFDLGNTYCSIAVSQDQPLSIDHMVVSEWKRHPCYQSFKLESYLGVPILVHGDLYGTLNFSSTEPKHNGFVQADIELIKLLAEWTSSVIIRQKIEQQLTEKKDLYRLISSNTADMVCLHKPDGTYEYVSPSVENLLGYTPEELVGTSPYELFHPEDRETIEQESHQKALEDDPTKSFHYRIKKKDGTYVWFDTATESITDEHGTVIKLQTTSRDITERKRLELLFSQAQKMAHIGGWELILETGDLLWTEEVYRIHELPIGSTVDLEEAVNYYAPEAREIIQEKINTAIEQGGSWDLILPFITAKGNHLWVRAKGMAEMVNGKAIKLIGTFQDVSIQKKNEQQIQLQNEELKALTQTRDKIYSILTHDLKGAFFGIIGILGLLKEDFEAYPDIDPELTNQLGMVEASAQYASVLMQNLLDWIRLQNGALKADFTEIDLSKKIQDVVKLLQPLMSNKDISIQSDLEYSPMVFGDAPMLSTILRNMLNNAIKFSHKGGLIEISTHQHEENLVITVKDYGVGMTESTRSKLFNVKSRPKKKGTMSEVGTGLGLLLCKEMIDLHNGHIEVESEVDKGSTFKIFLPLNP